MELYEIVETINTREDFVFFLSQLIKDLKENSDG